MKKFFTLLFVYFGLFSFGLRAQNCEVDILFADAHDCDSTEQYLLDVNFGYANTSDSFNLYANGMHMGIFAYLDGPVTIGPFPGDGVTDLEIHMVDSEDSTCVDVLNFEAIDCNPSEECHIREIFAESFDCDSTGYYNINLVVRADNASDSFLLYINGSDFGLHAYDDVPLIIGSFPGDGITTLNILALDSQDSLCEAVFNMEAVDCDHQNDCHIREIFAEAFDCDSAGHYDIHLVVRADNASDSFLLYINGVDFGLHSYADVPLTIGSFPGDGVTDLNILVIDSQDSICDAFFNLEAIDCDHSTDCHIREIFSEAFDCDSTGHYNIHLVVRADNASDSFLLYINGVDYGLYSYDDVPLTIGSFPGDGVTDLSIIVYDSEDSTCAADFRMEAIDCDHEPCHIREIFAEAFHCDSLGNYDIHLVVRAENASDSFYLYINGVEFGLHAYEDIPIRVGSFLGDGVTDLDILVFDSEDSICSADFRMESRLCDPHGDCELSHLIIESSPCDEDGRFNVLFTLSFDGDHNYHETYSVRVNGDWYGNYYFDELPQTIENIQSRNLPYQYVRICSNQHADCCIEREFVIPCCREQFCHMENARYRIWCAEDDEFYILLDFDKSGTHSDSFSIVGNGREYGNFAYADRPIILGPFERRNDFEFEFSDLEYHDCNLVLAFDEIDCDNPSNLVYLDALNVKIWSSGQFLFIDGIEDPNMKMRLSSLDGKQLSSNNMAQGRNQIWVGNVPPGVYIVTIDTNSRAYSVKVFIGN
jgi:hypothetical protein